MALLEQWQTLAYNQEQDRNSLQNFWNVYFEKEKNAYASILKEPDKELKGTVQELADHFGFDLMTMTGFLDGINESLKNANPVETMEADTEVTIAIDKEALYKNMVEADAEWLYGLEEWNDIFDEETRKALYREQKDSHTVRKPKKVGRNDPCPCGSGKKYKFCCGKK